MDNIYFFEKIDIDSIDENEFNSFRDKTVFTTIPWIKYIEEDSAAEPYILRITDNTGFKGYFSGLIFKKFGISILGSPFPGWSTCHMGIDTNYDNERIRIIDELIPHIYKNTDCKYIEIVDRHISMDEAKKHGYKIILCDTLEMRINLTDEELFKQMKTDCRNFIRQFERRGARLEIAEPNDEFAEEYYMQLEDVFAKQGLVPTYSCDKVKCLLKNLRDSDEILCLKVISPDDRCIATSIFPGYNEKFFFWGGASYRPDQHFRPNEYMIWTAIKYWREKGCKTFDMVGVRDYKKKFGSHEEQYARIIFEKNKLLGIGRNIAEKMYYDMGKVKGTLLHKK